MKSLTLYPLSDNKQEDVSKQVGQENTEEIPEHQRSIARTDGREDEDYNSDVENLTHRHGLGQFRENPLNFMIRLTAESSAFFSGSGWRAYENYIGSRILYPEYTDEVKRSVFESARVQRAIRAEAISQVSTTIHQKQRNTVGSDDDGFKARYERELQKHIDKGALKAKKYMDGLIADMSSKGLVRTVAFIVNNILVRMYNQGIHIKESEFREIRRAAKEAEQKKQSLIFLPCHKSHVDYLVISYIFYRFGIALPHIAAGDNLNIPVVGNLLQHGGAFFIRRTFGDDPLYQEIVKEYVEQLLVRGHNIEVFIEGTRSRMGKLLQPKFGILKIVLESLLNGVVDDCTIVPMSIDYDKVIETETYVSELLGTPKQKESLSQVLNSASLLRLKLGRIDIRFAKPYSLKQWIQEELVRRTTPDSLFAPSYSPVHKNILLQSFSFSVLADINRVSVIMPTALVGTIILTLRGRGVGRDELVRRVSWLRREILLKGGKVADFGGAPVQLIVDRAVSALSSMLTVRKEVLEPVIHATKRFELSLYRNQVMHLFLGETIVCAAMYATIKKGQTQRRLTREMLLRNVVFISQLLKVEFIFKPGSVEENLNDAVRTLVNHRILSVEDEQGKPYGQLPVASAGDVPADIIIDELPATYFVKLSDVERTIGRENYDFYCFLIWPFIETYWLAAVSLFSLIPTPPAGGISEKTLMDRVQFFGKTLYYEGDLGYFESVNKETIKNAFKRYQDIGFLITKTVYGNEAQDKQSSSSASQSSTAASQQQSQQLSKFATKLYAIHPSYEAEVLPFIDQPLPNKGTPYRTAYKFNRNSDLSREFTLSDSLGQNTINGSSGNSRQPADIYSTRLWMFAEEIGKFRREGKHRRDNEVTGKRTLRLARMARAVGNSNGTANSRI